MAAAATDKFSKAYQRLTTTLASDKNVSASSMTLSSSTSWPTDTGVIATVYDLAEDGTIDTATAVSYAGVVSGSNINNLAVVEGTDQLHSGGATVSLLMTAEHFNRMVDGILVHANQDGTLKDDAVTTDVIADDAVTTLKIADDSVTPAKWTNPYCFSAYRNATLNLPSGVGTTVIFDTENYDINSDYDTSTGVYTAPVDGVYHFDATINVGTAVNTRGIVRFKGNVMNLEPTDYEMTKVRNMSGSISIKMDAGDTCYIEAFISGATTDIADTQTVFSGNLIHEL